MIVSALRKGCLGVSFALKITFLSLFFASKMPQKQPFCTHLYSHNNMHPRRILPIRFYVGGINAIGSPLRTLGRLYF